MGWGVQAQRNVCVELLCVEATLLARMPEKEKKRGPERENRLEKPCLAKSDRLKL